MGEVASRNRFDRNLVDLPTAAEVFGGQPEVCLLEVLSEMANIQAKPPVIGAPGPDKSVLCKRCGCDSYHPGPARMHALRPGAVFQELETAARHGQRDALRHGGSIGIETQDAGRRQRAAERADQPSGVKPDLMKAA